MSSNLVLKREEDPEHIDQVEFIRNDFDEDFYTAQLAIRNISVVDPASHYLTDGWHLGLDPSPEFSTNCYRAKYSDVQSSGMNPFLHYILTGRKEKRAIDYSTILSDLEGSNQFLRRYVQPHFDADWYVQEYPGISNTGLSPIEHYLNRGWQLGNNPSADFDSASYQAQHMTTLQGEISPLVHFLAFGQREQLDKQQDNNKQLQQFVSEESEIGGTARRSSDAALISTNSDAETLTENADIDSTSNIHELPTIQRRGKSLIGNIDGCKDGKIYGWILAPSPDIVPVLLVDDRPMLDFDYPVSRSDVNETLGITGDTGFIFEVNGITKDSKIELRALCDNELVHVADYQSPVHQIEENFFSQLETAVRISKQPGSVAITCWDGGHNPIGRAKVLYDVVSSKRPAVIIAYLFESFGERIWSPMLSTDVAVLTIPWAKRGLYIKALISAGLKFDTVWICKPRFPSFELATLVSRPDTAVLLDFDDNEEQFSKSPASKNKAYGQTTINYSRLLTKNIKARTAASISLTKEFEARMVRHARKQRDKTDNRTKRIPGDPVKIGFIGTVRSHKNILDASRAVNAFNWSSDHTVQLHVYGDVSPVSLATDLEENNVVVQQNIPMAELYEHLEQMDVILTGFPSTNQADNLVTEFQISSKIGDALSVSRPVLVPDGASVSDLDGIPGLFLFDPISFAEKLHQAIVYEGEASLPHEFTFSGAYEEFEIAEQAALSAPRAAEVFSYLSTLDTNELENKQALVLLWKQNDGGFYGRRVDQLARSYKRQYPSRRVIVLEMMHASTFEDFSKLSEHYTSEHRMLLEQVPRKIQGATDDDGVEYHQLQFQKIASASTKMDSFLLEHSLLPSNTTFILFPVMLFYKSIESTLRSYPKIVDVVDNQFTWGGKKNQRDRILQYYGMARSCDAVVFNSQKNHEYFLEKNVLDENNTCKVIPNWYQFPANVELKDKRKSDAAIRNIVYSGNMNDRIDWELLARLVDIQEDVVLHLIGTASRGLDELSTLLENDSVIYHGPVCEIDTIQLIQHMDVAIMPHMVDDVSAFMNPLKVHMYSKIGIPTISTNVPGIIESELLKIASSRKEFVQLLTDIIDNRPARKVISDDNNYATEYINLIESVRGSRSKAEPSFLNGKVA